VAGKDEEEEGWWPQIVEPPPSALGGEYMELELTLNAKRVYIKDGDTVHFPITWLTFGGDVRFRPETPAHLTINFKYER
jgi:hypothetical protein